MYLPEKLGLQLSPRLRRLKELDENCKTLSKAKHRGKRKLQNETQEDLNQLKNHPS